MGLEYMVVNIEKRTARKVELMKMWLGTECLCGQSKESYHWVCSSCWENICGSLEWKQMVHLCDAYYYSVEIALAKMGE